MFISFLVFAIKQEKKQNQRKEKRTRTKCKTQSGLCPEPHRAKTQVNKNTRHPELVSGSNRRFYLKSLSSIAIRLFSGIRL